MVPIMSTNPDATPAESEQPSASSGVPVTGSDPAGPEASRESRRSVALPLVAVTVVALAQVLLVLLFSWASSRTEPHDLPVVVAGPPQAATAVAQGLTQARPGAFDVSVLDDEAAAREAVTGRTAYAAIVLGPSGTTVYTASAASPVVAQLLGEALPAALQRAAPGTPVTVTDLVPAPADDPHGNGVPMGLIPITITSIVAGTAVVLLTRRWLVRLLAIGLYAVLAGALSTLALQTVLGCLTGPWGPDAAVLGLVALAVAAASGGFVALLGPAGAAVPAVLFFFFGFPFSGVTSAWELLPTPWGLIAQYLPVGAAGSALRSVAFFDGARSAEPLLVLGSWALLGLAGNAWPGRRSATS
jgi:hypothetical protein